MLKWLWPKKDNVEAKIQQALKEQETSLDLSGIGLKSLPKSMGQLTGLQGLNLSRNQLTTLPEWLGYLTGLQFLNLSDNWLTSLPKSLSHLRGLRLLDLSNNRLTSLPESLGLLFGLEILYLSMNQLTSLRGSLRQLTSLEQLYLHDNEALGLPPEVLGPSRRDVELRDKSPTPAAAILDYYFRTRQEARPLLEAKLILVGFGEVGKTCLVNRLVHDRFEKNAPETKGIQITQWPLRLPAGENIRLHVWDFGGQEIMHATHQFFLTRRSLYLLVLNGRQGQEEHDADYWLSLIQSFGGESPVIVVLNKIKAHPFDVNRRGLRQKFPEITGFVATDCEDGTGIAKLHQAIQQETDRLPGLRDAFPAAWFDIKERLAGMPENYLTFPEYQRLCGELGESDPLAQESLAGHLHRLGLALNYKDDPRLRDMHVLNPRWLTEGVYQILRAETVARRQGELRFTDLPGILDPFAYPRERHSFLLDLMRKFELCFSFPDEDGHYLLPDLLDKQQPAKVEDFQPTSCLNFRYEYPVLPEGLLPRFIVRTHVLSAGQPRWRTGVMLHFENCRALVMADKQRKKVNIRIDGPPAGRRRLLAVIRSDFDTIHSYFTFKPQEMVPLPKYPEVAVPYQELLAFEANGVKEFPKMATGAVLMLGVQDLLNGVDLKGARRGEPVRGRAEPEILVFVSYSHKDDELRQELGTHLKIFQRQGLIKLWHDRLITAGQEWRGQLDQNLERAQVILLLVSADFIASDYCYDIEMKRALERHKAGQARVIPIFVRMVGEAIWQKSPFAKLQPLPQDGKAVKFWKDRDAAWSQVADGIEKVIKELQEH
jgi:internalin A